MEGFSSSGGADPQPKELYDAIAMEPVQTSGGFAKVFKTASKEAIDFMQKLLVFNPKLRMNVDQALNHPYLKDFKGSEDETKRSKYKIIRLYVYAFNG